MASYKKLYDQLKIENDKYKLIVKDNEKVFELLDGLYKETSQELKNYVLTIQQLSLSHDYLTKAIKKLDFQNRLLKREKRPGFNIKDLIVKALEMYEENKKLKRKTKKKKETKNG